VSDRRANNTATASSGSLGDIAIAIGNGANADAGGGFFDFAFADGANSGAAVTSGPFVTSPLFPDNFDIAFVLGTGSTATISGFGGAPFETPMLSNFDVAAVFSDMMAASITGSSGVVDIVP
jgi:hypothetical protein